MANDQNRGKRNHEADDDPLAALRRLAALDDAGAGVSHSDKSSQADEDAEALPDWLELLLAKYGEQASMLIGVKSAPSTSLPPVSAPDAAPISKEASEVASLLEQMAAEVESQRPSDQVTTLEDRRKPARREDEGVEDQATDWLDQVTQPHAPPSTAPVFEEETPDWLSEIGELEPETEAPAEGLQRAEYSTDEEEAPDWLQELSPPVQPSASPPPVKPSPPESTPSESEIPDWMEELASIPSTEPSRAEEAHLTPEDEIPDWMKDLVATAPQDEEVSRADQAAESELPDWLAQLTQGVMSQEEEKAPPPLEMPSPVEEAKLPEEEIRPTAETELAERGEPELEMEAPAEPAEEVPAWLRRLQALDEAPPAEPPPVQPAPEMAAEAPLEAEEETPDWLRDLETLEEAPPAELPSVQPAPEMAVEVPVEPEAEIPDWLRDLEAPEEAPPAEPPSAQPPPEMAAEVPVEPEAEIPDWLRDLETPEEAPPAEPPSVQPPEMAAEVPVEPEEETPDWLSDLEVPEEAPPTEPPPVQPPPEMIAEAPVEPEAEVPDWLASLRASEPLPLEMAADEVSPEEYLPGEAAEEPDWLAELRTTSKVDALEMGEELVEAEEETLPDWLAELKASQAVAEMPPVSLEALEEAREDIMAEEEGPEIEFLPVEAEAQPTEVKKLTPEPLEAEFPPAEEGDALAWLAEIEAIAAATDYAEGELPPPAEEAVEIEEISPAAEAGLAPPEIPDWLPELEEEEPAKLPRAETIESEDVLAGIPDLLPISAEEPEVEAEPIAKARPRVGVPQVPDVEGARLFKQIVTEPLKGIREKRKSEAELEPESRRGRIVATLAWALIFITLIVAIALALVAVVDRVGDMLGGPAFREFFGSPLVIDPAPVNTFRAEITKLPPDSVVVVSFDYSPATEAEMGPLAQIILRDLLEHQARVVAVSLRPEGAAMAQRLFEHLDSEYPYGQRTINLGYLPGQTAGVRSLAFLSSMPLFQSGAQTLADYPDWSDVTGLGDVALIVAVADSPFAVRWWVEQAGPGTLIDRPMVAAVSAAADPSIRPYYNPIEPKSGQLIGLLSGIRDAAAYENRLQRADRAVKSLAAQSVAHLGLVVLSLGGTVVGFKTQATKE
ncbi:MAG: hypothetical protein JSV81_03165 [Anaerolineales bacterium]|nr:MAG: hypothetical protein JSV81_03165 [Anaerolineales bacterium]